MSDFDGPDVCQSSVRKARKSYRCEECRKTISKGDKYEYFRGLWVGDWQTYRTCLDCVEARNWLIANDELSDGHVFGELCEGLCNLLDGIGFDGTGRSIGALRRIARMKP